ncbi:divalent-cation tolerance protein CutA [Candidatus Fermentibacteria bacterium]|nr:divalent-cation tolerance protein CutA [Candidatus Fermentibacteria bacterium]
MEAIVVFVTAANSDEGELIAHRLLDAGLVACASVVRDVSSHFIWRGTRTQADECLLVMKTLRSRFADLCREVRDAHSYEVPEIIALPILEGDEAYLSWLKEAVDAS